MPKLNHSQRKEHSAKQLVDSFSSIPSRWLSDKISFLPMWGTLFLVTNTTDQRNIETLMNPDEPSGQDTDTLALFHAGWRHIADTGILGIEFDGELLLGIHGAGYDFYENHWLPLYEAMGYSWHD